MLTKKFYDEMFAHSFNIPVKVQYWDHMVMAKKKSRSLSTKRSQFALSLKMHR
jgi:hypothetical protein